MINRLRQMHSQLKKIAVDKNIKLWRIKLWTDLFYSRLFCGLTFREYIQSAYRYNILCRRNMMSMRNNRKINSIFNDKKYIHFLENKVDFLKYFSNYINRKWIYPKESSLMDFLRFTSINKVFICKPIDSLKGQGVRKMDISHMSENELILLFEQFQKDDVLVEECIVQHPEMIFNNRSVNTIRVFTIMDNAGCIHILKSVLRVGKGDSVVDNFCAGGVVYPVDKLSGIIEGKGIDMSMEEYIYHVGTSIQMIGRKIPFWDDVIDIVKRSASEIKEVRYIGWDVAVTNNGVDIIEANHNPDTDFLEFIGENGFLPKILQYK